MITSDKLKSEMIHKLQNCIGKSNLYNEKWVTKLTPCKVVYTAHTASSNKNAFADNMFCAIFEEPEIIKVGWATPQASDNIEGSRTALTSNQKCLGRDVKLLSETEQLNARLSGWLMGFPPEWCIAAISSTKE